MMRLGKQRAVERDVIGFTAERFKIDQLHPQRIDAAFFKKWIAGDDSQAPAGEFLRHSASDVAEPDYSKGSSRHPIDRVITMNVPGALFHFLVGGDEFADTGEQQADCVHRYFIN